ncbi:hypothetical protein [Sorangium sp. So ce131]|uniref:hypothetical protein n=1 Tax=Sorangium sp. So ce131 TaxID=3133282 RepID=UPI003F604339
MSLGRIMLAGCLSLVGCALVACGNTDADRYGEGHGNVVVVPPSDSPEGDGCTLTQGYWKNHEESWPTWSLVIGGVEYSQEELLEIFRTAPRGDTSLILGHQLIAALLNVGSGASDAALDGALAEAEAWMVRNKDADGRLPYGVKRGSEAEEAVSLGDKLADFNEGGIGPGHCDDGPGSSSGDPGGTGGGSSGDPDDGAGGSGDPDGGEGGCGAHDGGDSGSGGDDGGGDDGGGDDGGGDPSGTGGGSSVGTCAAACGDGAAACAAGFACIEGCCAAIVR